MKILSTIVFSMFTVSAWASPFFPVDIRQVPQGTPPPITQPKIERPDLFRGKTIAILASHGVEESEIVYPYTYLINRGATVDILVPNWTPQGIVASRFLLPSLFVKASGTFRDGLTKNYDLVVLTGGAWNAQVVRDDSDALSLIKKQFTTRRPIAAICAGTAVLINAGLTNKRTMTGSPVVKIDLQNSGAIYQDLPVVFNNGIVTSRTPNDLPYFVTGIKQVLLR